MGFFELIFHRYKKQSTLHEIKDMAFTLFTLKIIVLKVNLQQ